MSYKTLFIALFFPFILSAQNPRFRPIWAFDVPFDFGKSNLKEAYLPRLDSLAVAMQSDSSYIVFLYAHTDAVGSDEANLQLSILRGQAIQNYLTSKSIDSQRIVYEAFGEKQPLADNSSEDGRQNNRRVSVQLKRKIEMTTVSSIVKNDSGAVLSGVKVLAQSRLFKDSTTTDSTGFFKIDVPKNQDVAIDIMAKDHFYESRILKIGVVSIKMADVKLIKASIGRKMQAKTLHFYGGDTVLLPTSKPELLTLVRFMQFNSDYVIEIQGHINMPWAFPVGTQTTDFILSVNRAKVVYNFLVKSGIPANRMTYAGYGNWEMLYPKATTAGEQSMNRRVEIKIVGRR
jgi:outer membrane protein OmpA-like peptidoglycan-associated protein